LEAGAFFFPDPFAFVGETANADSWMLPLPSRVRCSEAYRSEKGDSYVRIFE
jgi:hypothetical protein